MSEQLLALIGARMRIHRRIRGLSQEELARMVHVSPEAISNIERAVHAPSVGTLEKILDALDVTVQEFFCYENSFGPKTG